MPTEITIEVEGVDFDKFYNKLADKLIEKEYKRLGLDTPGKSSKTFWIKLEENKKNIPQKLFGGHAANSPEYFWTVKRRRLENNKRVVNCNALAKALKYIAGTLLESDEHEYSTVETKILWDKFLKTLLEKDTKKKITIPLPNEHFQNFVCGKFEIPVAIITTCIESPYKQSDVVVHFKDEFLEDRKDYPQELIAAKNNLLKYTQDTFGIISHSNGTLYRIDNVNHEPEDENDNRGRLILHFSKTGYENMLATNVALEATLSDGKTVREKYGYKPYDDLDASVLSNAIGVEAILISNNPDQSPQRQVIIKRRSKSISLYREQYQVSASGYMSKSHRDKSGMPSPFVTAERETHQEVAAGLRDTRPDDFKLIGIGLHWHCLYPNFIGYYETNRKVEDILGDHGRDRRYEGKLEAIPFTVESVINHLAENAWTPMSTFAMISVLQAEFPYSEVEDAANKIAKPKTPADFSFN